MNAIISLIGEVVAWVGSLGILLSFVIPQHALKNPLHPIVWGIILGSVFTPIVRPIAKNIVATIWNRRMIRYVMKSKSPSSVEEAKRRGIRTPLDFCVYMAAYQIIPLLHAGKECTFYGVTEGDYGASKNHVFREMFGRKPLSTYNESLNYMVLIKGTLEKVTYADISDCWTLCVRDEAARAARVDPFDVNPSIVEEYISPEIKKCIAAIGETTVLAWEKQA